MRPRSVNRRLVAVSFLALVPLGLAACGSDDKDSPSTEAPAASAPAAEEPTVTSGPAVPADVADGAATITVTVGTDDFTTSGGTRVVSVPKGTKVAIQVTDPNADQEYHLHGYDLEVAASKGETGKIEFVADQAGQFDLESHDTEQVLLVLVVE